MWVLFTLILNIRKIIVRCIQGVGNCDPISEVPGVDRPCMCSSVPLVQARPFHHPTILLGVQDMTPLGLTGILRCSREVGNQGTIRGNPRNVFLSNISLLLYTPWVWCQCPLSDVLLGTKSKINWCFSHDSAALTHIPQISVA